MIVFLMNIILYEGRVFQISFYNKKNVVLYDSKLSAFRAERRSWFCMKK